jgi:hypothetical protein
MRFRKFWKGFLSFGCRTRVSSSGSTSRAGYRGTAALASRPRLRTGVSRLLRQGRRRLVISLGGGTKKPGPGHRDGARAVEGLLEVQVAGDVTMPLTREFKETVQARIRQDRK